MAQQVIVGDLVQVQLQDSKIAMGELPASTATDVSNPNFECNEFVDSKHDSR